jgi:hypothetical protein
MAKEIICAEDYRPLLPDGTYEAQCISYNTDFHLAKTRKTFLHFKLLEPGEHFGKRLFMAFNMPYDNKIKPGSK